MLSYRVEKITDYKWQIPQDKSKNMRVPGIIFADEELIQKAFDDKAVDQVINVATLPGIVKASYAMPDIHWGYGFPIGGVAAFDADDGVISPGGVGFDISCGVRMMRTDLNFEEFNKNKSKLMSRLAANIPKGVGSTGKLVVSKKEFKDLTFEGARWAVKKGYGWGEDLDRIEDSGRLEGANPDYVSDKAYERGHDQVGTLGSGNHFLEIQVVDEIFDEELAKRFGIFDDQITVMIHCGSRGFGHQICTDYIEVMDQASRKYGIMLVDRQLACAPVNSDEGKKYYSAMVCAVNYALVNRECLSQFVRDSFEEAFGLGAAKLNIELVYDISHNIAKFEEFEVNSKTRKLCVHRKGATRSWGPGEKKLPDLFKDTGQPVIIPGDMGTSSYLCVGTIKARDESFSSTCHGAGRLMSRSKAKKIVRGDVLKSELEQRGIAIVAGSMSGLAEEAPEAYKDVTRVVDIAHNAGLSRKVAKMVPVGVVKG
ncbi:MAG: RtcB family protein [Actinobacteria bacterium]|nr:RtcB family protein [Actinomycetota bacterium]